MNTRPNPSPGAEPVRVVRMGAQCAIVALFTGDYRGTTLHWQGRKSVPCCGLDRCPSNLHKGKSIWRAYAPSEVWDAPNAIWRPAVLEITSNAEEFLRGHNLRGEVWTFARMRVGDKRSPVLAQRVEVRPEVGLRPRWNIEPVLLRFFGVESMLLDVPNPTPQAPAMEPAHLPAPVLPTFMMPEDVPQVSPEAAEAFRESCRKQGHRFASDKKRSPHEGNGVS